MTGEELILSSYMNLISMGIMVLFFVWMLNKLWTPTSKDKVNERYDYFESVLLEKSAEKKGINLTREIEKLKALENTSVRDRMQKQIINDFFEPETTKTK